MVRSGEGGEKRRGNTLHFRRILVVRNPASTRAAGVGRHIRALEAVARDKGIGFSAVETSPGGRQANKALIHSLGAQLGPETLLCIAAGDGTVNLFIEALLTDPALPPAARKTVVLPLWGGNANDLAHMLNGAPWRTSLQRILGQGTVVAVHPLECRLSPPDGAKQQTQQQTHLAICYASFGASAFAAHRLATPATRHHPLDVLPGGRAVKELAIVIKALMDAPQVTVHEGARTRKLYEHIFINGPRFAKVQGISLELTAPHFYHMAMRAKRVRTLFFHIWELTAPRAVRRVAAGHVTFTPTTTLWAQVDGEVFALPAGTTVDVQLSAQPVYVLASRIAAASSPRDTGDN
ncbi:MAG TPA: diacylglycerol kinase family protein [Candidatus Saccharimonadales bacterium]|nr:diacylglycerol kinase family protein [Candidatus Saccharimonadales bacterium]